jgi:LysM repeat protein
MKKFLSFIAISFLFITISIYMVETRKHNKPETPIIPVTQAKQTTVLPVQPIASNTIPTEPRKEIIKYTVKPGDTIGAIAEQFNITIKTILLENNLTANSMIKPGDVLSILPLNGITYTIKNGDTISKIASATGVSANDIAETNNLSTDVNLTIGQILIIPGATSKTPEVSTPKTTILKPITSKTAKKSTTTSVTSKSSITWTSGALSELRRIPSFVRSSVKAKVNNYAKSHNIKLITKQIYLSIKV